jgi:hypothetical protein
MCSRILPVHNSNGLLLPIKPFPNQSMQVVEHYGLRGYIGVASIRMQIGTSLKKGGGLLHVPREEPMCMTCELQIDSW